LSVAHATLTLAQTTGLTVLSGANGQGSMVFSGTPADVNAALNGLVYEPSTGFFGSDALGLTVDDQGASGLGKAQQTTSSVAISVNGPPTAQGQTVTTLEDTPVTVTLAGTDPENDALSF